MQEIVKNLAGWATFTAATVNASANPQDLDLPKPPRDGEQVQIENAPGKSEELELAGRKGDERESNPSGTEIQLGRGLIELTNELQLVDQRLSDSETANELKALLLGYRQQIAEKIGSTENPEALIRAAAYQSIQGIRDDLFEISHELKSSPPNTSATTDPKRDKRLVESIILGNIKKIRYSLGRALNHLDHGESPIEQSEPENLSSTQQLLNDVHSDLQKSLWQAEAHVGNITFAFEKRFFDTGFNPQDFNFEDRMSTLRTKFRSLSIELTKLQTALK